MTGAPTRFRFSFVLLMLVAFGCGGSQAELEPATKKAPTTSASTIAFHGKLVGHNGQPMPMAHVTIDGEATQVAVDGTFRFELAPSSFVSAKFTGVDHGDYTARLVLEESDVEVIVALGTYAAPSPLENLSVVELRFGADGNAALGKVTAMVEKEGVFGATVATTAGEYAYEIRGTTVNSGLSMNGNARTVFRYDGDGNYCNVVESKGGPLEIEYDPTKSHPMGVATTLAFTDAQSRTAKIEAIFAQKQVALVAETDPVLRHARTIALFASKEEPSMSPEALAGLARTTLSDVPTTSVLWAASPGSVVAMANVAGPEHATYVETLVQRFLSEENLGAAAQIALGMLASASTENDEKTARYYYSMFQSDLAKTRAAQVAKMFDPDRLVRPGATVPNFSLKSVDTKATLTAASFGGKVVLIDFWATWCAPCMSEMPNLHATYEKYKSQGFEILSINIDDEPGSSQAMRKLGTFPMPWSNVVVPKAEALAIKKTFEVSGLPTMILVGKDGRIIASDGSLRGPGLERQVSAALAPAE